MSKEPPIKGMKTIPMGLPLMFDAWMSCVLWAASEKEVREAFTKDTGNVLQLLTWRSPLCKMVDEATGYDVAMLAVFCDYVTKEIWGEDFNERETTHEKIDTGIH